MRLVVLCHYYKIFKVSIHASVKDATIGSAYIRARKDVSIHASVKDATQFRGFSYKEIIVSIHASVKDATLIANMIKLRIKGFNPRICKRCDRACIIRRLAA